MRRTTRDRIAGLLAALTILVLVIGVPMILIRVAGWPLPRTMPDWSHVRRAISQGDIPADTVVRGLAVVVWLIWFQVLWALIWELVVNVPRVSAGRRSRPAPLVAAPVGHHIGRLVALVLMVGGAVASTPSPATALPAVAPATHVQRPAVSTVFSTTATPPKHVVRAVSSPQWKVSQADSLWKIAESALGDGERSGEILQLNGWLSSPRHLKPGHVLSLPEGATVPSDRQPELDPPPLIEPEAEPTVESSSTVTYLSPTQIVIEPGDSLWKLSEQRLSIIDSDVTASETLALVDEVIAANPDVVEDPNLIYPGEVFAFPAVGTPPVEAAPPEVPAIVVEQPSAESAMPAAPTAPIETPDLPAAEAPATLPETTPLAPPATRTDIPSTPSTAPPVVAPAAPDNGADGVVVSAATTESGVPWLQGITGATTLASGVLLMYRRRLRVRSSRGASAYRASTPLDPTVLTALVRAADVPLIRWANSALADLLAVLRPGDVTGQPLAIELSESTGIEMLWTEPNGAAPEPWGVGDEGWSWRLAYDADAPVANAEHAAAMPALVTVGRRDGNQLLLNLEAVGALGVTGDASVASDFVRSLVVELASGDVLSDAFLVASGVELDGLVAAERVQIRDVEGAGSSLGAAVEAAQQFLATHQIATAFEARLGGDATGRETTIVAIDAIGGCTIDHVPPPGLNACLVAAGEFDDRPHVALRPDGSAVLEPLGIEFDPVQLPLTSLEAVCDLLDEASEPLSPASDSLPGEDGNPLDDLDDVAVPGDAVAEMDEAVDGLGFDHLGDDDEWTLPEPEVLVRVLGAPEVVDVQKLGRIESSIVTYLACHGGKRRDEQIINAVWNGRALESKTLWNKISKIRSVLGPDLVPPRQPNSPNVNLSERVMTDLTVLSLVLDRSTDVAESEAMRILLHGLDLIEGAPFDSAEYDWAFESQDYALACETVEAAALKAVDIGLNLGDLEGARRAVLQGLRALPLNEPLYRARMRVEAAGGNPEGVRRALNELTCALDATADGMTASPELETVRVARSLLGAVAAGG